jgi:predicted ATP-dependent serine protease
VGGIAVGMGGDMGIGGHALLIVVMPKLEMPSHVIGVIGARSRTPLG